MTTAFEQNKSLGQPDGLHGLVDGRCRVMFSKRGEDQIDCITVTNGIDFVHLNFRHETGRLISIARSAVDPQNVKNAPRINQTEFDEKTGEPLNSVLYDHADEFGGKLVLNHTKISPAEAALKTKNYPLLVDKDVFLPFVRQQIDQSEGAAACIMRELLDANSGSGPHNPGMGLKP